MEPKKPTKKAAKKSTKKAVAPTPPPPPPEPQPAWDIKRRQFEEQVQWKQLAAEGYEPFAASGNWIYWRKKLD